MNVEQVVDTNYISELQSLKHRIICSGREQSAACCGRDIQLAMAIGDCVKPAYCEASKLLEELLPAVRGKLAELNRSDKIHLLKQAYEQMYESLGSTNQGHWELIRSAHSGLNQVELNPTTVKEMVGLLDLFSIVLDGKFERDDFYELAKNATILTLRPSNAILLNAFCFDEFGFLDKKDPKQTRNLYLCGDVTPAYVAQLKGRINQYLETLLKQDVIFFPFDVRGEPNRVPICNDPRREDYFPLTVGGIKNITRSTGAVIESSIRADRASKTSQDNTDRCALSMFA